MSLRIIFMGTPEFAVPSLNILLENGYDVVGVVTATDKWGGRGNKELIQSDVKKFAVQKGLNILQPEKLKNPEFIEQLRALNADLQIVVAFRMLPEVVWTMPRLGTMNVHGSLLPKYRGAAPINWAIINGEAETGVTTFFLKHEIDTGDLVFQEKITIEKDDTAGTLHDKMKVVGANLLLKTVQAVEQNNYTPTPQDISQVCHAPKIFHETCEINFAQSTQKVYDFIRGLAPYPAAWTMFDGEQVKIYKAVPEIVEHTLNIGTIVINDKKTTLKIATLDGFIQVEELQMNKRKRLVVRDFLNGYSFQHLVITQA